MMVSKENRFTVLLFVALTTYAIINVDFPNAWKNETTSISETNDNILSMNVARRQLQSESPEKMSCDEMQKYLMITDQRSGSTWTSTQIDNQDNISSGVHGKHEMLVKYTGLLAKSNFDVSWSDYTSDLDEAFRTVCEENPAPAIGFKLMTNQIPEKYKFDGHLEQYLTDNNIAVIQLVREATILRRASSYDNKEEFKVSNHHTQQVNSREKAENLPEVGKMPWTSETVEDIVKMERANSEWQRSLQFMPSVRNYYLSYENLLSEEGLEDHFSRIISFLLPFSTCDTEVITEDTIFRLHSPTCFSRMENYDELAKELEKAGALNTVAACRMLEDMYETVERSE